MINIYKAIVKQVWLDAIDECIKQAEYGSKLSCSLCNVIKNDQEDGWDCKTCICAPYANCKNVPWKDEPCGDLLLTFRIKTDVQTELKLMRRWLKER